MIITEKSKAAVLQLTLHIYKSNQLLFCFSVPRSLVLNLAKKKKKNQEVKETKKFNFTLRGKEGVLT